jgi:hypothetical protein
MTQQVNTMIGENCELPFLSKEPKSMLQTSEASSANVQLQTELELSANIQLQTERADGQLNLTTSTNKQIELADGHPKKHIDPAKRQTEHADGQIEHNDKHTSIFVKWQVKRQIEQAKKRIE